MHLNYSFDSDHQFAKAYSYTLKTAKTQNHCLILTSSRKTATIRQRIDMRNFCAILFCLSAFSVAFAGDSNDVYTFRGSSDASAAVALDEDSFIVADDENNVLRAYKFATLQPVFTYDLAGFLATTAKNPEADIEGATKVGNRIYWITSHGRNKDGKIRLNRYRFFATDFKMEDDNIIIKPAGKPCRTLVHSLLKQDSIVKDDLARAAGFSAAGLKIRELENLAPKKQGLNIEGLCASADGKILYIGFRNPLHKTDSGKMRAIVIPLKNADSVIEKNAKPVFGEALLWNLDGSRVRSMEYSAFHKAFFIIAGPADEKKDFALYKWSGDQGQQPEIIRKLEDLPQDFTPETLFSFENSDKLFLLSDDGTLVVDVSSPAECLEGELPESLKCQNKYLTDPSKKTFRGFWLEP
jgi:hypothetical protein